MESPLRPLYEVLCLNRDLFLNCLEGLTDADLLRRLGPRTNNIAFLAVHAIDARHFMATLLGSSLDNPWAECLADVNSIEKVDSLPGLDEIRDQWTACSEHLVSCFHEATANQLEARATQEFPIDDPSTLHGLAYLLQHEAYHLGQVSFLRKQLGYEAMTYDRAEPPDEPAS